MVCGLINTYEDSKSLYILMNLETGKELFEVSPFFLFLIPPPPPPATFHFSSYSFPPSCFCFLFFAFLFLFFMILESISAVRRSIHRLAPFWSCQVLYRSETTKSGTAPLGPE